MHMTIKQTSKGPYLRVCHTIKENPIPDGVQWIKVPFSPGEVCWVRETWRPESPINGTYKGFLGIGYKDGTFELTGWPASFEAYPNGKWRSPITMPQWAARSFVRILTVEPMQVKDVGEEDAIKAGVLLLSDPSGEANWSIGFTKACLQKWWHLKHPGKEWAWIVRVENTGREG
jgi:hypothetical protein